MITTRLLRGAKGLASALGRQRRGTYFSAPWRASTFPTSARSGFSWVLLKEGEGGRTDVPESNRSQRQSNAPHLLPERGDDGDFARFDVSRSDEISDEVSNWRNEKSAKLCARGEGRDLPMLTSCSLKKEAPSSTGSSSPATPWNHTEKLGEGSRAQA